ncbi:hypothetical protein [Hymenobacter psoromatis]|uniref:hypothetical protein n=1 Tax=Hymenobacter psoromatis TaxID=1484116 RepID=UPI001CBDBAA7|nr:hypothetical protein [Hymenobacter psoromatis]
MTRATLLQLLAHPTALTGADVRALEQLAAAFPYCQTAHLLLAKAAHDQGSMLASQRLRRAATYAADRARLRQLLELPAPAAGVLAAHEQPAAVAAGAGAASPPHLPEPTPTAGNDVSADASTEALEHAAVTVFADLPEQVLEPIADQLAVSELAARPAEEELPAVAPPVRPPAEATASTEFGLTDAEPGEISAYRLPEMAALPTPGTGPSVPATALLPPFTGVADVGYAPGEGSRLGFCLLLVTAEEAMPTTSLPPADEFFAPDALLLVHLVAHEPAPASAPVSSLDLINSFLQRAPTASRRRAMPSPAMPDTEAQADLSVRSTRPESDLASESLAKILARQGKVDRAVAIYERLIVKYPGKMAYFAAQIESLRSEA